ncbi:hypothetical protein B0A55_10087 [Friedmanniomyces simplex]|uniref:C2H2-type domain-containing protein n=1 Tax=Friedmanniomyces simplex TaxID=329884 RepID=A0A4U0WUV3_9PEZI|nr:hypothetical protein B0A55_10087 [Friedmanniomyces simplex]
MAYPAREGFQSYPQQYPTYSARAHQTQQGAAPSSGISPYAGFNAAVQQSQQQQHPPLRHSDSSGSRTSDEGSRPSLPSISNLLGIADGDRSSHENDHASIQSAAQQTSRHPQPINFEPRPRQSFTSQDLSSSQRTAIPPTPPLRNDSVLEHPKTEHTNIPPTISTSSSSSAQPYYIGSALNNVEADHQRVVQANFLKRHSIPSQPNTSPYNQSPYKTSPYNSSPGNISTTSYYSPTDPSYPASSLYHQRPLPSNFPPPPPPQPGAIIQQSAPSSATSNPWEHHHYISPSSQATFPQSQDRYICQTCNKAFSRPSSLKIHSHSHTGEKPFRCPHAGCGKAFSVRSNMKRHERGCHTGANGMGH